MRLLRLDPKQPRWILEDFPGPVTPVYAILSHTWGRDEDEVKFEDIQDGPRYYGDLSKAGYDKLRFCQERVEKDGLVYFWIDTCCIKKSDSSELQRSLASMFYWYQRAARCYVYLSDVSIHDSTGDPESRWELAFSRSRWFKRGWTLQELIAPSSIFFFSKEKSFIGDKKKLASTISTVTHIPGPALEGVELWRFSRNERMSWAQNRVTTVPEDAAYCLIGIFDVEDLSMLYAEGDYNKRKDAAMKRLQKAIEEKSTGVEDIKSGQPQDVVRIGGASWNDLSTLNEDQLRQLDLDLEDYQEWLLFEFPKRWGLGLSLCEDSKAAGKRMKDLLAKHRVRYEDLSGVETSVKSWQKPWNRYNNETATAQVRVQALVENRCFFTKHEYIMTIITAAKTFEDLMTWRGTW
ncbi:hypothetical protein AG0111_0g12184 [Alternaria gaisen]|uniref:Uncharacterized protein n=1 Tax=Alternaria gaisen TaxID=167740 RepID=A0ACB6F5B3_9PLEO|nr:hypothetical protein AG0111_0g12184 [Alternaria gaisen]